MDIESFLNNPTQDCLLNSPIPSSARTESCILGIDEAGRGPVLGPMVYAVAYFPQSKENQLKQMDFADSKTLTEEKREKLFNAIGTGECADLGWCSTILSPVTISNSMFKRSKYNLNELSHDTAISLINRAIESGVKLTKVFVDTVGPADKYQTKLKKLFPDLKITVANKADSTYPIVSAASICAKVLRDRIIHSWKFIEGNDFVHIDRGSGYPSDPTTKSFLETTFDPVFGFPSLVRFSWSTAKKYLDEDGEECEWEDENEDDEDKNNHSIVDLFKNAKRPRETEKECRFFKERNLKKLNTLDL